MCNKTLKSGKPVTTVKFSPEQVFSRNLAYECKTLLASGSMLGESSLIESIKQSISVAYSDSIKTVGFLESLHRTHLDVIDSVARLNDIRIHSAVTQGAHSQDEFRRVFTTFLELLDVLAHDYIMSITQISELADDNIRTDEIIEMEVLK